MAATISSTIGAVSVLRSSGLFSVRVATPSATSTKTKVTGRQSATVVQSGRWSPRRSPQQIERLLDESPGRTVRRDRAGEGGRPHAGHHRQRRRCRPGRTPAGRRAHRGGGRPAPGAALGRGRRSSRTPSVAVAVTGTPAPDHVPGRGHRVPAARAGHRRGTPGPGPRRRERRQPARSPRCWPPAAWPPR